MEELLNKVQDIFKKSRQFEQNLEDETELFIKKVEDFCKSTSTDKTPLQNKKRPKNLSPIADEEDVGQNNNNNHSTTASTVNSESEESMSKTGTILQPLRAVRTAKLKAAGSLKEKRINEKERQPSICKPIQIKMERISSISTTSDMENDQNVKNTSKQLVKGKDKVVDKDASIATEKKRKSDENSEKGSVEDDDGTKKVKLSDSIELVPTEEERVEISDEESAEKMMPPPTMPAPKTRKPRTKQKVAEFEEKRPKRSKPIKQEKEEPVTRSTRSKQKPKKKVEEADDEDPEIPRPIQIKKEKLSLDKGKVAEEPVKRSTRTKNKDPQVEEAPAGPTSPARSEKSVYEDAVSNEGCAKPVILLQKLTAADLTEMGTPPPKGDETFVKQPGSANATYNVAQVASTGTPGISDATFDVNTGGSPAVMDGTFDVLPARSGQTPSTGDGNPEKTPKINESLMTEDNSQDEESENESLAKFASKKALNKAAEPPSGPKSTKGKKNELFNPNIHSPIKRKIEAFEKAAASSVYASPAQLRPKTSRIPSKYNTPNLNLKPKPSTSSTATTPTAAQSLNTLMANAQNIKAISSSTSKLAHIQKKQNATSNTKSHSLSREPSAEDLRRANSNALEEKKKKREEKLRLVQQQKEQIEKEKREQAEKQMREREEKYRKMMEEKELEQAKKKAERKRLEEIKQANVKMQEQAKLELERAEELKRLEEFKRIEREKLEIMKLNAAKDTQNMLQKQMYQQKLLQQQQKIQLEKLHKPVTPTASASQISKATKPSVFELLHSDDSTDDEANPSKKRPPPPEWSKKPYRNSLLAMQSHVSASVIDAFFSVQPMTPDLREIFPAIDQRRLKRNSSAVWRTPPRYSQIPKY